jgi:hypothetical protein
MMDVLFVDVFVAGSILLAHERTPVGSAVENLGR